MNDFWVFGYGSLIWKPGFEYVEEQRATLNGYKRRLCIYSWHYRGTKEKPGLVLGLDVGGSCQGVARLVSSANGEKVIEYLREREMFNQVYKEVWVDVELQNRNIVKALTFVADSKHSQYIDKMPDDEVVACIKQANGIGGPNIDYVTNTIQSLKKLDIEDVDLEKIAAKL